MENAQSAAASADNNQWTDKDTEEFRQSFLDGINNRRRVAALTWAMEVSDDPDPPAEPVEAAIEFLSATNNLALKIGTADGIPPKLLAPLLVRAFGASYIDAHLLDELIDITRGQRERADARRAHDPFDPFSDLDPEKLDN